MLVMLLFDGHLQEHFRFITPSFIEISQSSLLLQHNLTTVFCFNKVNNWTIFCLPWEIQPGEGAKGQETSQSIPSQIK